MADFTPILIADNAGLRASKTNDFELIKIALASVVLAFNAMTYSLEGEPTEISPLESSELSDMLFNPYKLIVNNVTNGEGITIGGLAIEHEKAFEIIAKPTGFDEFAIALEGFKDKFNRDNPFYYTCGLNNVTTYFSIDEEGEVVNSSALTTMLSSIGKVYTTNVNQNATYNFISGLFTLFSETVVEANAPFKNFSGGTGVETFVELLKNNLETCDPQNGTFQISISRFGMIK